MLLNKTLLNLCLRRHILRSYCFVVEGSGNTEYDKVPLLNLFLSMIKEAPPNEKLIYTYYLKV